MVINCGLLYLFWNLLGKPLCVGQQMVKGGNLPPSSWACVRMHSFPRVSVVVRGGPVVGHQANGVGGVGGAGGPRTGITSFLNQSTRRCKLLK